MKSTLIHFRNHSGSAIAGGITQLPAIALIAKQFGPEVYGRLAVFMSLSQILALLTTLNLSAYSVSIQSRIERMHFAATLVTGSFVTTSIAQIIVTIYCIIQNSQTNQIHIYLPIYALLQAISAITVSLHLASARTRQAAASYISRPLGLLILATSASYFSRDSQALIASLIISELITAIILYSSLPSREKKLSMRIDLGRWFDAWRKEYRFYLSAGLGAYLSNLAANLPTVFGGLVMPPQILGNFALAQRLAQAPIAMIAAPICAIANRSARQRRESGQSIDKFIRNVFLASFGIGFSIFTAMWLTIAIGQVYLPPDWLDLNYIAIFVFIAGIFQFSTSTIGFTPLLLRRMRFLIIWSGTRVAIFTSVFTTVYLFNANHTILLAGYATCEALMSLVFLIFSRRSSAVINVVK